MKKGKKTAKAKRTAAKPQRKRSKQYFTTASFEETLLDGIVNSRNAGKVSNASIAFNNILSNFTPSLSAMHFRYGMKSGKLLFKLYAGRPEKRYRLNPMLGIFDFFERVGYNKIKYSRLKDWFRIEMHGDFAIDLGHNMHSFESGIISGFVTAAERSANFVSEKSCEFNNAEYCRFESDPVQPRWRKLELNEAMRGLSGYITDSDAGSRKSINSYYCNLLWETLLHSEYKESMKDISYHCGGLISKEINKGKESKAINELKAVVKTLNLGALEVKKSGKMSATLKFDNAFVKHDLVEFSLSFIKGFLDEIGFNKLTAQEEFKNRRYEILISEE